MSQNLMERPSAIAEVSTWVRELVRHTGYAPSRLGKIADVAPSTVLRYYKGEDDRFQISLKTLQKLSEAADNYPIPRRLIEACGIDNVDGEDRTPPTARSVMEALGTLSHTTKLGRHLAIPVKFVSSLVPRSLHPVGQRSMTVRCPPKLEDDENAFAFQAPDNSLDPWIKAGSTLYATTTGEPKIDDLVLITDREGRSRVRMLVDMDETGMILSRPIPFGADEHVKYGQYESIAVIKHMDR